MATAQLLGEKLAARHKAYLLPLGSVQLIANQRIVTFDHCATSRALGISVRGASNHPTAHPFARRTYIRPHSDCDGIALERFAFLLVDTLERD